MAVDGMPVRAVVSVGRGAPLLTGPPNVNVVEWIELPDILNRVSMVLCHGGSGTTLATLEAGVPMVIVPMLADQPANAAIIESLGAGVTVAPTTESDAVAGLTAADAPRLRHALDEVLTNPSYRMQAERAAAEDAKAPTVDERLDELRRTLRQEVSDR